MGSPGTEKNKDNKVDRREFIKLFSYSIGAMTILSTCEMPVRKAIPYLIQPEDVVPGKFSHYASTFADINGICPVVVKVRDGRPVKIEGNELCKLTGGGTTARVQASILSLYDPDRLKYPSIKGAVSSWDEMDQEVIAKLETLLQEGKKVYFITPPFQSPSTRKTFGDFLAKYPNIELVEYHPALNLAMLQSNEMCFNKAIIPSYSFSRAEFLVSFGADFLGTWLSPAEYARQYAELRNPDKGKMARHVQFESSLTITGSKADKRVPVNPDEELGILSSIYNQLAGEKGIRTIALPTTNQHADWLLDELKRHPGKCLVISSSVSCLNQSLVNGINDLLGNYHSTIDLANPQYTAQAKPTGFLQFLDAIDMDMFGGFIVHEVNPSYDFPSSVRWRQLVESSSFKLGIYSHPNETCQSLDYICPAQHYLESWDDLALRPDCLSLMQPVIHPIFNTRQVQDSLLAWSGLDVPFSELMRARWRNQYFKDADDGEFMRSWLQCLQKGIYEIPAEREDEVSVMNHDTVVKLMERGTSTPSGLAQVHRYEPVAAGQGYHANNPWLQELPDPLTKICWDNFALVSMEFSALHGLVNGDIISINNDIEIPVLIHPGQANHTISIASGYGRKDSGRVCENVGVNLNLLSSDKVSSIKRTGSGYEFSMTQPGTSMHGRDIVREYPIDQLDVLDNRTDQVHKHASFYDGYDYPGHHWGMVVDLHACTGCNACVIACQAENNIPVVGKEGIRRGHGMHWIRIDRYLEGNGEGLSVYFQPLMCQHCDHAPCENVCPVSATTHSAEGINQMIYNRCIGTRYCANNCPYKVRRFNWYDHTAADAISGNEKDPYGMTGSLPRMVLNPDVTIRAKGVIEKCSFCIQRIQAGKTAAKEEGRSLKDGDIVPACAQSCPSKAIIFGDMNDKQGRLQQLLNDKRGYRLLPGLQTLPSVLYMAKIKNKE